MQKISNIAQIPEGKEWLDFSSLSTYMRCPRQYYWRYFLHIVPNKSSNALLNGKVYHDCLAVYYGNKEEYGHVIAKTMALNELKKSDITEIQDDPVRNLNVAVSTLDNYFDHYKEESYKSKAIEVGFAVDIENFVYVGKIDRVVDSILGTLIVEQKTTTIIGNRWQQRVKPNAQIDGYVASYYILTGEMPYGACLDVIPLHATKINTPFRIITARDQKDIDVWLENIQWWYQDILRSKESKYFKTNTEACVPLLGFSCDYCMLCEMYKNPSKEVIYLPEAFKIEKWQPWDIEGVD